MDEETKGILSKVYEELEKWERRALGARALRNRLQERDGMVKFVRSPPLEDLMEPEQLERPLRYKQPPNCS